MNRASTIALTALAPITWGTTYLVTTEMLPAGHPLFAALIRALPAGLIALAIGRALPQGTWWFRAGVLGILNIGAFFPLLFLAAERLPGGAAAAVAGVQPLILLPLGALVLQDRPRITAVIAAAAGTTGVALIVLGPASRLDTLGIVAAIAGVGATAAGIILTKKWGRPPRVGAVAYAGWQLTAGGLFLLPLTLGLEGVPQTIDTPAVVGYVWLAAVGGFASYTLWFRGIQLLPVVIPGLLVLLSPIVATLLGVFVAGESFTIIQGLGLALVAAALIAGPFAARRSSAHAALVAARP
ncbi:putative blue pigment (indigoidine) exporter [Microbacterium keratanolyticum]|uniref:ABC transporter permease n=1 Tax=Microbacterium keratanolyticum TaxID=67574 RepID=A0A9W6HU39_9MICO|nr:EamA family transporter [Microbacterium keratanolyticum]MBM7467636.1 putative blue pigment (indigoidine) exporter [Microbacterium keratanolyticum]GLK02628.1 ABC transporter permease [Microbacterium keratanolyticum]